MVALVDEFGSGGGAERLAVELTMQLNPDRFERVLCMSRRPPRGQSDGALLADLRAAGVEVLMLSRRHTFDLPAWRPLLRMLRDPRTEVLHAHKFGSNVWGTLLGRLAGVPVLVAHEHSWPFDAGRVRRLLDRWLIARWSDALIAVSTEDRRRMIEIEGIPQAHIRTVANGISRRTVLPREVARERLGLPPDATVVGAVGLLRPEKAYDVFLRSAALLIGEFPTLNVALIGEGPERPRLEGLAEELGLGAAVRLVGFRRDAPELVRALDVAVICSHSEGSPLALMEYMQAGVPTVATCVGGVPEIVEDRLHALLVEPGHQTALAEAIGVLLRDPEAAYDMGRRAQERQRRQFDLNVVARRFESLYDEVSSRNWARRRGRRRTRKLE